MAVAWIGNRETLVERAVAHAATLLGSSRCPVFSFDTDIHGTRAAIALAERVGAAYDHIEGAALARETALITDKGAMTIAPGEARRRGDMLVIVGDLPKEYDGFLADLANSVPDLSERNAREIFLVGTGRAMPSFLNGAKATRLAAGKTGLAATLAALRAQCAGRKVSAPVSKFDDFAAALAAAKFPVFLFSGLTSDTFALEMLQGLVADLNGKARASSLHLPASESGWGSALASTWMTGFAPRTGFARGFPEFDPWRFDIGRMILAGEADLHLRVSTGKPAPVPKGKTLPLIMLAKTLKPVAGAAVTFAIGEAGIDHDAIVYRVRTGTLNSVAVPAASALPSAAEIIRSIGGHVSPEAGWPC
ncbi:MAG: tungsten formylmethanofuran dehydrogenase [Hyphomicrobiales bacterium]|nr:tungsten formylmethanofuran dehydrogenase [Hyphomicrobiales bacterium]